MANLQKIPNTREGRIVRLQNRIEQLEDMLASGILSASIDGVFTSYRSDGDITKAISRSRVEIAQLRNGTNDPNGVAIRF